MAPQVETELILTTANQRNVDAVLDALEIFSTLKSSFQNHFSQFIFNRENGRPSLLSLPVPLSVAEFVQENGKSARDNCHLLLSPVRVVAPAFSHKHLTNAIHEH